MSGVISWLEKTVASPVSHLYCNSQSRWLRLIMGCCEKRNAEIMMSASDSAHRHISERSPDDANNRQDDCDSVTEDDILSVK
jgi:hypothetical protein